MSAVTVRSAWEQYGSTEAAGALSAEEALNITGLNWETLKRPMYYHNGRTFKSSSKDFATVRSDDPNIQLGTVGRVYKPRHNREAFGMFDAWLVPGSFAYDYVGYVGQGTKVWAMGHSPELDFNIGRDYIKMYLLITNSHDGSKKLTVAATPVLESTNAVMRVKLGPRQPSPYWENKHTTNMDRRMSELGLVFDRMAEYMERLHFLCRPLAENPFTAYDATDLLEEARFPLRLREKMLAKFNATEHTAWSALKVGLEVLDHTRAHRNQDSAVNAVLYNTASKDRLFRSLMHR